jgi:hypothetical protein
MTDVISTELVLKCDRKGRVKTPVERQEEILAEFDRSGMSGMAFAQHCGIKYQTFVAWRRKRRERNGSLSADSLNFVEAVIEAGGERPAACGGCVRVQLPGGASVEMGNQQQAGLVACLIRNLALGSC